MTQPNSNNDGENDLAILYPERSAIIAGVAVTMREYTFAESLKHHALIAALSDAMTGIALKGQFADLDSLRAAFGEQADAVMALIAIASDQPVDWVTSLGADDGEQLHMLWWSVNSDFFLKRVLLSVQLAKVREVGGAMFSPPSPPPGTGTRDSSAPTRSVN
ncbi:DUF6631 family protein [Rhodanobacter sp. BL-MT-08]